MTYVTGSRTSAPAPSAGDLYGLIATQLTNHPNWDLVEDYVVSTASWSVWRCGAANVSGAPYHVFFGRNTTSGADLCVGLAEGYDAATHSYTRPAPNVGSSTLTPTADGSYSTTPTALTATYTPVTSQYRSVVTASATAYDYRISVNNDALFVSVSSPSIYGVLVSPFDSLVSNPTVNDPVPLMITDLRAGASNSSSSMYAWATRHPLVTTAQARLWSINLPGDSYSSWNGAAKVGYAGTTTGAELYQGGMPTGARNLITAYAHAYITNGPQIVGKNRGLTRHMIQLPIATGVVVGDTVTVGADTYVYTGIADVWYNTSVA